MFQLSMMNNSNRNKTDEATKSIRSPSLTIAPTKPRQDSCDIFVSKLGNERNSDLKSVLNQVEHSSENVNVSFKTEATTIPNGYKDSQV